MTLFTYSLPGGTDPVSSVIYVDQACTVPAAITELNGAPIPDSVVTVGPEGASFQSAASPVFSQGADGSSVQLTPQLDYANPTAVTGSRSTQTAAVLESLIQAVIMAGVPITDATTA